MLVRNHQAELIIAKRLIQGRNNMSPDHAIRIVVKTTTLLIQPRCRLRPRTINGSVTLRILNGIAWDFIQDVVEGSGVWQPNLELLPLKPSRKSVQ